MATKIDLTSVQEDTIREPSVREYSENHIYLVIPNQSTIFFWSCIPENANYGAKYRIELPRIRSHGNKHHMNVYHLAYPKWEL